MSDNPFNRAAIEEKRRLAGEQTNDPVDAPRPSDDETNQGTKENDMTVFEQADAVISSVNSALEGANAMKGAITEYGQEKYNEGFQAGKDSIEVSDPTNPDNIYTQAQMNEAVNAGKAQQRAEDEVEFGAKIAELQGQIDGIPAQIEAAKVEAVSAKLGELKTAYEAQQVVEQTSETGFADLLK